MPAQPRPSITPIPTCPRPIAVTSPPELQRQTLTRPTNTLVTLRREQLIRSWSRNDHGNYDIVVGRGTVALAAMSPAAATVLAGTLRRDQVTVVGPGYPLGHRTVRYNLSDGRVTERHGSRVDRLHHDFPYTVRLPGGDQYGYARDQFATRTLKEALALAGLDRVRGRCTDCGATRPLRVSGTWIPDPALACPGCTAGPLTPAHPWCAVCEKPITHADIDFGPLRFAWAHISTNSPNCDVAGTTPNTGPSHTPPEPAATAGTNTPARTRRRCHRASGGQVWSDPQAAASAAPA